MKKVYFDSVKCLGCHSCAFACAVEHSESKDAMRAHLEAMPPVARRKVQLCEGRSLTVACRHCEPAPCVEACIAGAMRKRDGRVQCDEDKCVGCWMCVMVCPFDAVRPGRVFAVKCDSCAERSEGPVCVAACPTGALFEDSPADFVARSREKEAKRKAAPAR